MDGGGGGGGGGGREGRREGGAWGVTGSPHFFSWHLIQFRYIFIFFCQHTIQNKVVFLPIVARLDCGFSPANPKGRWEEIGSGLVAVYKSDWERFHGMATFTIITVL